MLEVSKLVSVPEPGVRTRKDASDSVRVLQEAIREIRKKDFLCFLFYEIIDLCSSSQKG